MKFLYGGGEVYISIPCTLLFYYCYIRKEEKIIKVLRCMECFLFRVVLYVWKCVCQISIFYFFFFYWFAGIIRFQRSNFNKFLLLAKKKKKRLNMQLWICNVCCICQLYTSKLYHFGLRRDAISNFQLNSICLQQR